MHFIPLFEIVICFYCPKFCSVQKDDIISEYVSQVKINVTSNWSQCQENLIRMLFKTWQIRNWNNKYFSFQFVKAVFDSSNCPFSVPLS